MVKQLVLVALGGALGSILRYLTSWWIGKQFSYVFPLATFIVNTLGCFIIGFLIGLSIYYRIFDNGLKYLLIIGFCGGYTTFSTFSAESFKLFETGNYWTLALYVAGSVLLGILAVWAGVIFSKIVTQ